VGYDLTERGYRQIEALAELFAGLELDAVYSSPLGRALATARTIARPSGLEVRPVDDLREIRTGDLSGWQRPDVWSAVREFFFRPDVTWDVPYVGGGETFRQLSNRVLPFFESLVRRRDWRRVAVVAHGGVNLAIIGHLIGANGPRLPNLEQDFGCVNVIDLRADSPTLRVLNFTAHDPLKTSMEAHHIDLWYEHTRRSLAP